MQIIESVESTPDWEAREERRSSERRALAGHGLNMEDLTSMCERQCWKACNLRSAAEELEETGSNGRARRYRKCGSPKPAAEARAMETDSSPVRKWSAADSEGHSDGYRTVFSSESEEMAIPPTRAHTAPEPSLEHDAEALERPARARTAPVARHMEPTRDSMGDTPMAPRSPRRREPWDAPDQVESPLSATASTYPSSSASTQRWGWTPLCSSSTARTMRRTA